ncbi:RDM1 [Acanthosepion pharaonis]|uniref:RDM1 n=1 Tax=Acanthosepion pharaonis TaxID=158019 RepID=A0A812C5P7_ACAPH|nr:RDM1 [Sepia pharaonis]
MMSEAEIIDFVPPHDNYKSLYISNISPSLNEDEIYNILYKKFSEFGLIYGIRIFPVMKAGLLSSSLLSLHQIESSSNTGETFEKTAKLPEDSENNSGTRCVQTVSCYYAFVNFYSRLACQKARRELSGNFFINGQPSKVIGAKRSKVMESLQMLPLVKCQELAGYYLGFNGWSTRIKLLKENIAEDTEVSILSSSKKLTFCCLSEVVLEHHGIVSEGFGAWEESYTSNDSLSKIVAFHKAKKISYQRSLQDAFSKIILVVLPNGKVAAERNSSKVDIFWQEASLSPVLKVNHLDSQPENEDIDSDFADTSEDLDNINIQLLQELEES